MAASLEEVVAIQRDDTGLEGGEEKGDREGEEKGVLQQCKRFRSLLGTAEPLMEIAKRQPPWKATVPAWWGVEGGGDAPRPELIWLAQARVIQSPGVIGNPCTLNLTPA